MSATQVVHAAPAVARMRSSGRHADGGERGESRMPSASVSTPVKRNCPPE
jgi:hypothetical protein